MANTISGNTAYYEAGGAEIDSNSGSGTGGTITLTGNTVANNHAYGQDNSGSGVYCWITASSGSTGTVSFEANTITGNSGDDYVGVYAVVQSFTGSTGAIIFTNNIIAANSASDMVGGVYASSYSGSSNTGPITFINNTITKNSAVYGYGGVQVNLSNNAFNCYNNIIWGNTGSSPADLTINSTGTAYGYNNDYHDSNVSWNGGSNNNIDRDPLLDTGGHYHLTSNATPSPCIDAGDGSAPGLPAADIDGNSRVIGARVDIGAVEYSGPLIGKAPANGFSFGGDSFVNKYQPTFQWIAVEPFKSFTILFSTSDTNFSSKEFLITQGSASGTSSSWTPSIATWEKLMTVSYNGGGVIQPIYWKVVGTEANKSTTETPVRYFQTSPALPPAILSPAYGATLSAATPPVFVFYTNYNIKFRLEISPDQNFADPKQILAYSYTVTNPVVTPILQETLSSSQWTAVKNLVGIGLADTGFLRIKAWDGINGENDSLTQSFKIQ
jgi:hypothetical protein